MGCCASCCCYCVSCLCLGSNFDPDDPSVTAYIFTTRYQCSTKQRNFFYQSPSGSVPPRAVYIRGGILYFDINFKWCLTMITGQSNVIEGYPLTQISSVDILRVRDTDTNVMVNIRGNDGTVIVFTAPNTHEADTFVDRLKIAANIS